VRPLVDALCAHAQIGRKGTGLEATSEHQQAGARVRVS
jgi:hypothetical protein